MSFCSFIFLQRRLWMINDPFAVGGYLYESGLNNPCTVYMYFFLVAAFDQDLTHHSF